MGNSLNSGFHQLLQNPIRWEAVSTIMLMTRSISSTINASECLAHPALAYSGSQDSTGPRIRWETVSTMILITQPIYSTNSTLRRTAIQPWICDPSYLGRFHHSCTRHCSDGKQLVLQFSSLRFHHPSRYERLMSPLARVSCIFLSYLSSNALSSSAGSVRCRVCPTAPTHRWQETMQKGLQSVG
jgi:hypothetical protein